MASILRPVLSSSGYQDLEISLPFHTVVATPELKNMIDDLQNWLSGIFASLNYSNYNHLILYAFEVDKTFYLNDKLPLKVEIIYWNDVNSIMLCRQYAFVCQLNFCLTSAISARNSGTQLPWLIKWKLEITDYLNLNWRFFYKSEALLNFCLSAL